MNNKSINTTSEIEAKKRNLKRGQAVLEVHVTKERKVKSSSYIKADVSGTLTIKGHVFHHVDANILGLIAYVCDIRSVQVFSQSAEPGTTIRARYHHTSLKRQWIHQSDEGRYLTCFDVALVKSTMSKREPQKSLDWWEREKLPVALLEVPAELRVNIKFERGVYDEKGYVMKPVDFRMREQAKFMKELFENLGQPKAMPVTVGNVIYLREEYVSHR